MAKLVDTQTVRESLGDIINQAHYRGAEFLVQRRGKPLVAIIPYHTYEHMLKLRDDSFKVFKDIQEANAEVDLEQLIDDVQQAVAEARAEKRDRTGP